MQSTPIKIGNSPFRTKRFLPFHAVCDRTPNSASDPFGLNQIIVKSAHPSDRYFGQLLILLALSGLAMPSPIF
jgi:hypothetical protein